MAASKALLAVLVVAGVAHGQPSPKLLLPFASTGASRTQEEQALARLTKEQGAVSGRLMTFNRAMLPQVTAGAVMVVPLTPADTETVQIESAVTDADGTERVAGQVQGTGQTGFLMVVDKGGAAATVDMGTRFFEITSVDANTVAVIQIDRTQLPDEEGDSQPESAAKSSPPPTAEKSGITSFRVLIVYTPEAAADAGGADALRRDAALAVMQLNTAFTQSQVRATAVLAGVQPVSVAETGTSVQRLEAVVASQAVKNLRAAAKADIATLFMATLPGNCGIANLYHGDAKVFAPRAFSIVKRSCATNGYSYAHEIGHNLGCAHNVESNESGAFTYSHAFRVFTETTGQKRAGFRTIDARHCTRKSDPNDCERVLFFSNPNVIYLARATGTATADNARTINKTIGDIAKLFSKLP